MRKRPAPLSAGTLAAGVLLALSWATPAHAYIDGGTGGLIVQLLLTGLLGLGVVLKIYWQKFKGLFGRGDE